MRRKDIRLPPPPEGWDFLQFVDGYKAQIVGATVETVDGIDFVTFYLRPLDDLAKRYNITLDMLDEQRCILRTYPKDYIVTLNEDDPTRKLRFCLLNWDGKETPATRWFMGLEQIKTIEKLRIEKEHLKVENAALREQNIQLKTNVPKFIKNNFEAIAGDIIPIMERLRPDIQPIEKGSNIERR